MRKQKLFLIIGTVLVIIFICSALFQISKSRSFQFFGEIIPRIETNEKVVALTFDDGPTEYTNEVVEILKQNNIKATFYVMGNELEKHPQIGKAIVTEGHELGNHTYSHKRMWFKSQAFIAEEIEKTNTLIRASGYKGTIHFRPPYGKKLFGLPWYLSRHNIKTIMWDVEPDSYGTTANYITQHTLDNTRPGSIILLHPFCQSCSGQRESLAPIIKNLNAKGYRFVTVSELLKYHKR